MFFYGQMICHAWILFLSVKMTSPHRRIQGDDADVTWRVRITLTPYGTRWFQWEVCITSTIYVSSGPNGWMAGFYHPDYIYLYFFRPHWVLKVTRPDHPNHIYALSGLNGLSDGWCHPDHICVTRLQWVKWRVGINRAIYASPGLNGLSDGLVPPRLYMRHQALMG